MLGSREGYCLLELVVISDRVDGLHKSTSGPWGRNLDAATTRVK